MRWWHLLKFRLKRFMTNPVMVIALLGLVMMLWGGMRLGTTNNEEVFALPIGVVDLDQTHYSKMIIQRVAQKDTVQIVPLLEEEAIKQVSRGKLEGVYILKVGLMNKILEGDIGGVIEILESPVSLSTDIIGELFAAEVMRLSYNVDAADMVVRKYGEKTKDKTKDQTGLWEEAWQHTDQYWEPSPLITIDYSSTTGGGLTNNDSSKDNQVKNNLLSILMMTVMMFSILISCGTLLHEKNNGIIKRIISSGMPLWGYVLSSVLGVIMIHLMVFVLVILGNSFISGGVIEVIKTVLLYTTYMIWVCSIGILIIAFADTMQQLLLIIPFITALNGFMGGLVIFSERSYLLQKVCTITPMYWMLQGNHTFGKSVMILALYAIVGLVWGTKILHVKVLRE